VPPRHTLRLYFKRKSGFCKDSFLSGKKSPQAETADSFYKVMLYEFDHINLQIPGQFSQNHTNLFINFRIWPKGAIPQNVKGSVRIKKKDSALQAES